MGKKIKVVQALLTSGEGGAQTYFEKMVFAFQGDSSIEQKVITVSLPSRLERFDKAGIDYLATGNLRSDRSLLKFFQSQFAKLYDRWRIDRFLRNFDPDIIVSYHNTAPAVIKYPKAIHIARMGHGVSKKICENCNFIVVNQPTLRHQLVANGFPKNRVQIISNFSDFPEDLRSNEKLPELPPNAKILITLGRLHPTKAQDTLIEAMALLPENTHLLIAGSGRLESHLKDLVSKLNLRHRVHFLGLRRDVPQLLSISDVVVLPSRREVLGNVILEAWDAGKPVVAADSDGPRWLIDHGKTGLLFEIDNVEDCGYQLKRILSMNHTEIDEMVSKATLKLEKEFSKTHIVNLYKSLFHRLLKENDNR